MHVEQPDRFGRTVAMALALWISVGGIVWLAFVLVFQKPSDGPPSGPGWHRSSEASSASADPGVDKAREVFSQRCVACHGPSGHGDGPASASLSPRPRRFSDASWQASVTDDHIEKVIKYGGAAVGKSPAMPSNPDLQSDGQLIAGLRTVVREFKR